MTCSIRGSRLLDSARWLVKDFGGENGGGSYRIVYTHFVFFFLFSFELYVYLQNIKGSANIAAMIQYIQMSYTIAQCYPQNQIRLLPQAWPYDHH